MDLQKEYTALMNKMNRYKTKPLLFEDGCLNGEVRRIELIEASKPYIVIHGVIGFSDKERELLRIYEDTKKKETYHYWPQYHILERLECM